MADRIQKVLANAGLGSRREVERWIRAGRVVVDGRPAELGQTLAGEERILLDGKPVRMSRVAPTSECLAYYKPTGEISTRSDPENRPTVFERLPRVRNGRWISIGRLDVNTSGLLLFTTDGELAFRLMHPGYELEREYAVRLMGSPTDVQLDRLTAGIPLDDGMAQFLRVQRGSEASGRNEWLHVVLKEGRNREVRRMFEALDLTVSRLIRVRYGPIRLDRMHRGRTRPLTPVELDALYGSVQLPTP